MSRLCLQAGAAPKIVPYQQRTWARVRRLLAVLGGGDLTGELAPALQAEVEVHHS